MLILLITHIIIAISGLIVAAMALLRSSKKLISLSYTLTAGTLISGTGLVIISGDDILKSCLSGLLYLAVVIAMTMITKHRLAFEKTN